MHLRQQRPASHCDGCPPPPLSCCHAQELCKRVSGVRGRLFDLVSPTHRQYKTAVATALGRFTDAVVVDTEAAAKAAIVYLREAKVQPMIFLPLDVIVPTAPDDAVIAAVESTRGRGGAMPLRFARDVIKYDPDLERAVGMVCGGVVIADTLADAKDLRCVAPPPPPCHARGAAADRTHTLQHRHARPRSYRRKIVAKIITLDGVQIAKNGNMTGGAAAGDHDAGAKWSEKESALARQRRDELLMVRTLSAGRPRPPSHCFSSFLLALVFAGARVSAAQADTGTAWRGRRRKPQAAHRRPGGQGTNGEEPVSCSRRQESVAYAHAHAPPRPLA